MRLIEITAIIEAAGSDMALIRLGLATKELRNVVAQANKDLDDALEHNDPGMLLPSVGKVSKWFKDNYLSSKGGTGHNINTILQQLSKEKAFAQPAQQAIKDVNIVAGRNLDQFGGKNAKSSKKKSNLQNLGSLVDSFTTILNKAPSTHLRTDKSAQIAQISKALRQEYGTMQNKVKDLSSINMKDRGVYAKGMSRSEQQQRDADLAAGREKTRQAGEQRSQADAVVNQVLGSLPDRKIAGQIRQEISKQDNKLQALAAAMKKYGLSESMKYFRKLLKENALI